METWGRHRKRETNGLGDHKPKHLFETSLWQAWVAWNERGQILGTENVRRKIIRIHHWFTTQTSTMAMFELDSQLNNPTLPTSDVFMSWMSLQGRIAGMDSFDRHVEQISFRHCITFFEHGNMGPTSKEGNKRPWRPQTKTSIWNFTVTGMSCLERARTNFGYRKCTAKNNSNPSLIHNSNIDNGDVRAGFATQ